MAKAWKPGVNFSRRGQRRNRITSIEDNTRSSEPCFWYPPLVGVSKLRRTMISLINPTKRETHQKPPFLKQLVGCGCWDGYELFDVALVPEHSTVAQDADVIDGECVHKARNISRCVSSDNRPVAALRTTLRRASSFSSQWLRIANVDTCVRALKNSTLVQL
jgi:hypothetical protein